MTRVLSWREPARARPWQGSPGARCAGACWKNWASPSEEGSQLSERFSKRALPTTCGPEAIDWEAVAASPVACDDAETGAAMCEAIDAARDAGESLGGVFEVWCWGICPGLGGYATMQDRLDGRLMGALGSIPGIKGVEIGDAFANARRKGSGVHDPLVLRESGGHRWIGRDSNRAAGLEGGMTNGMPVVLRVAMKPIPTLMTPLGSVDIQTLEEQPALVERSDVAAVPAAAVVGEAMTAYVMATAYMDKFGGDSLAEVQAALGACQQRLKDKGLWRSS
jgi:chorismate synthase